MSSLIHALRAHRVCVEGNGEARGSEENKKGGGRRGRKGKGRRREQTKREEYGFIPLFARVKKRSIQQQPL